MKAALWILLTLASVQNPAKFDAVATKSYNLPDGSSLELAGVCRFNEDHMSCWDSNGKPDDDLTKASESAYSDDNLQLPLKFHKKNRLVVFKLVGEDSVQITSPDDTSAWFSGFRASYGNGKLGWVDVMENPEHSTTKLLLAATSSNAADPIRIPFKSGAASEMAGTRFEVGGAKPVPPPKENPWAGNPNVDDPRRQKQWAYLIGVTSSDAQRGWYIWTLLDRRGIPFNWVSRSGKPAADLDVARENPPHETNPGDPPSKDPRRLSKYVRVTQFGAYQDGTVYEPVFNVDPAEVGFIQVIARPTRTVLFKDIPLDPK